MKLAPSVLGIVRGTVAGASLVFAAGCGAAGTPAASSTSSATPTTTSSATDAPPSTTTTVATTTTTTSTTTEQTPGVASPPVSDVPLEAVDCGRG